MNNGDYAIRGNACHSSFRVLLDNNPEEVKTKQQKIPYSGHEKYNSSCNCG